MQKDIALERHTPSSPASGTPEFQPSHTYSRRPVRRFSGSLSGLVVVDLTVLITALSITRCDPAAMPFLAISLLLAFAVAGLYRTRLHRAALDDLPAVLVATAAAVPVGGWLAPSAPLGPPAFAAVPLAWPVVVAAALVVGRALAYGAVHRARRRRPGAATLVIGSGALAVRLAEALAADRGYGLEPLGMVGPAPVTPTAVDVPLLGPVDDLDRLIAAHRPRVVVVAFAGQPDGDLVATLRECRRLGITVYVVPRLFELGLGRGGAELVRGIPLVRIRPEPPRRWRAAVKRAVDVAGAGFGLALLAPVFAACALAVRLESRRVGVLFRQERIGLAGRPFTIMKFRSLTPASDRESQVMWNINHDARLGRVGRLLRSTSLDELPQLVNVLRGDMSLVGPRPERPYFVEEFRRAYGGYMDRHRMPAGITGWAQIHGLRGDTSIEERVRFDNYYIENWSLGLDLKIMIRTVAAMLGVRRG